MDGLRSSPAIGDRCSPSVNASSGPRSAGRSWPSADPGDRRRVHRWTRPPLSAARRSPAVRRPLAVIVQKSSKSGNASVIPSSKVSWTSPTASGMAQPVRCACTTIAPV